MRAAISITPVTWAASVRSTGASGDGGGAAAVGKESKGQQWMFCGALDEDECGKRGESNPDREPRQRPIEAVFRVGDSEDDCCASE